MIKIIKIPNLFKKILKGGEDGIVSSLIDKLVELWYGSLFTFLVVKVITCRAEQKSSGSNLLV